MGKSLQLPTEKPVSTPLSPAPLGFGARHNRPEHKDCGGPGPACILSAGYYKVYNDWFQQEYARNQKKPTVAQVTRCVCLKVMLKGLLCPLYPLGTWCQMLSIYP